jgi:hypothetical protein
VIQIPRTIAILRSGWMVLSLAVLFYCLYVFDGRPNSDSEQVLIILMFVLSFPAAFVAGGIAVGIAFVSEHLLHAPLNASRLEMFFVWILFSMLGYLQWFVLVPRIWSRLKHRHSAGDGNVSFTSDRK